MVVDSPPGKIIASGLQNSKSSEFRNSNISIGIFVALDALVA